MNRTAFVSGTDHGLGLALAEELRKRNYTVFGGVFKAESLGPAANPPYIPVSLDIASDESVRKARDLLGEHGVLDGRGLDLLINNAGILGDIDSSIEDELDFDGMRNVLNVNALGALRLSHALIPLLKTGSSPCIVNISSEAGSVGASTRDRWFAYCMSKSALNMESKLLHNYLRPKGIDVMVVHPGWLRTHMRGSLDTEAELSPEDSARDIVALIEERRARPSADLELVDGKGKALPW